MMMPMMLCIKANIHRFDEFMSKISSLSNYASHAIREEPHLFVLLNASLWSSAYTYFLFIEPSKTSLTRSCFLDKSKLFTYTNTLAFNSV